MDLVNCELNNLNQLCGPCIGGIKFQMQLWSTEMNQQIRIQVFSLLAVYSGC